MKHSHIFIIAVALLFLSSSGCSASDEDLVFTSGSVKQLSKDLGCLNDFRQIGEDAIYTSGLTGDDLRIGAFLCPRGDIGHELIIAQQVSGNLAMVIDVIDYGRTSIVPLKTIKDIKFAKKIGEEGRLLKPISKELSMILGETTSNILAATEPVEGYSYTTGKYFIAINGEWRVIFLH